MIFANHDGRLLNAGVYFDVTLAESSPFYKTMLSIYNDAFSFKRIMYICQKEEGCQHLFTFNFDLSEAHFLHQCINNLTYLKKFIDLYTKHFSLLIEETKKRKNRFLLPDSPDQEYINLPPQEISLTEFCENNAVKLYSADSKNIITLTKQQSGCFRLLAEGKRIKEISKELNLSPRTVENYLRNVRQLTGYKNTTRLIAAYLKNK